VNRSKADLSGANLTDAVLVGTNFLGANLPEVVSHDLEKESGDRRHG
jgi:uncharacterized protein YjbI with pentapeptide repeats